MGRVVGGLCIRVILESCPGPAYQASNSPIKNKHCSFLCSFILDKSLPCSRPWSRHCAFREKDSSVCNTAASTDVVGKLSQDRGSDSRGQLFLDWVVRGGDV